MAEDTKRSSETEKLETETALGSAVGQWPWPALTNLRDELEQLFDDTSRGWRFPRLSRSMLEPEALRGLSESLKTGVPAVDVVENDDNVLITVELPGMSDEDVDISVSDDLLTIKGEKKEERDETKDEVQICERRYGAFQRSFRVPENVAVDKITARSKDGILELTLPKTEEAKREVRKISIGKS